MRLSIIRLEITTALIALLFIMVGPTFAQTSTPPPLPTLPPLAPTATSQYAGLRPTPTMITVGSMPEFNLAINSSQMGMAADTIINGYRFTNISGVMDIVWYVILVISILGLLFQIAGALKDD